MTTKLHLLWERGHVSALQLRAGVAFAEDFRLSERGVTATRTTDPRIAAGHRDVSINTVAARRRVETVRQLLSQESWRVVVEIAARDGDVVDAMALVEAGRDKTMTLLKGGLEAIAHRVYALCA